GRRSGQRHVVIVFDGPKGAPLGFGWPGGQTRERANEEKQYGKKGQFLHGLFSFLLLQRSRRHAHPTRACMAIEGNTRRCDVSRQLQRVSPARNPFVTHPVRTLISIIGDVIPAWSKRGLYVLRA